jgi:hypothetical protein
VSLHSRRPGRPAAPRLLGDDASLSPSLVGTRGEGFVGVKVQIALDGETARAAQRAQFARADVAELLGPSMALALRARLRRFKTAVPF